MCLFRVAILFSYPRASPAVGLAYKSGLRANYINAKMSFCLVVTLSHPTSFITMKLCIHIYSSTEKDICYFLSSSAVLITVWNSGAQQVKYNRKTVNLLLYWILRLARPVFFFFFCCFSTLGVWPFTLPEISNRLLYHFFTIIKLKNIPKSYIFLVKCFEFKS